jgi:hypothetical protein
VKRFPLTFRPFEQQDDVGHRGRLDSASFLVNFEITALVKYLFLW